MKAILLADNHHRNYHTSEFFTVYSDEVLEKLNELTGLEAEPVFWEQRHEKKELLQSAELIFSNWGMPELDLDTVTEWLPNVKAVFYAGGDVRHFAIPYFQREARVFCTGSANAVPASEYALSQILQATKGVQRASRAYRSPDSYAAIRELVDQRQGNYHASVGILGVGRVGSRLAKLLQHFDFDVYGCDPFLQPEQARELKIRMLNQEELFSTCDVISCHLPDRTDLHGAISEAELQLMREQAVFINAGQAAQVDQDALIRHFAAHPMQTAILDSTVPMPLPEGHPLFTMENVIITPHIAGSFGGELERMGDELVLAVREYLDGTPAEHEVTRARLPE